MLLSICMPTYNRKNKAIEQAKTILQQIKDLDNIEFIISDNCSEDNTYEELLELTKNNYSNVKIVKQQTNLGLVGNVHYLFNQSRGKYVWFISDDDILLTGSIENIIRKISDDPCPFYLLNFKTTKDGIVSEQPYWNNSSPEECFKSNWGGFGLVSAEIMEKKTFVKIFELTKDKHNLCHPVVYSLYGIFIQKGKILVDDIFLYYGVGPTSWDKYKLEVGSIYNFEAIDHISTLLTKKEKSKLLKIIISNDSIKGCCLKYLIKRHDYKFLQRLYDDNLIIILLIFGMKLFVKKINKLFFIK